MHTDEIYKNTKKLTLVLRETGPVRIYGKYKFTDAAGNTIYPEERISLCRCGESSNMPYCDGTHKRIGFKC